MSSTLSRTAPFRGAWARRQRALLRAYLPGESLLMGTAVVVGLGAGVGAVVFRWLISVVWNLSFEWLPRVTQGYGRAYVVIAPVVGGLIVGPLTYFLAREAKGHGVPEVMEAVALRGGRIRPVVAAIKSLASSVCIGTGGSVGREGPIVQIGSSLGSTLGQLLRLSDDRVRNLVACGAAGGIAATFNAPIAGVFFALEVILGDFSVRTFGSVVLASVTASVVGRAAFGNIAAFVTPSYALHSVWELPLYLILGLVAAGVAVVYTRVLYATEDVFDGWRSIPEWTKPAVGGLLLGTLALVVGLLPGMGYGRAPQVFGVGYDTIERGLGLHAAAMTVTVMLTLAVLKVVGTSLTLGSGGSGGIFAPSLFVGAMLGSSFGTLMAHLFPGIPAPAGAYALVGMGAVFAGATQASMTAIIIMFEMTGDYKIILPLMLAVITSTLLSGRMLRRETIYTLKLSRRGVRIRRGQSIDVLERIRAEEVMSQTPTVTAATPIAELAQIFLGANRNALPVVDEAGRLAGIVSLSDLRDATSAAEAGVLHVRDVMSTSLVTAFSDETLGDVLRRMGPRDLSRLPVVARDDPQRLLGVVRRNDVVRAYNLALTRLASAAQVPSDVGVQRGPGLEVVEIDIPPGSACVGSRVAEISRRLPAESLLVLIRRADGTVVFPRGDTLLLARDCLVAYARPDRADELRACFGVR